MNPGTKKNQSSPLATSEKIPLKLAKGTCNQSLLWMRESEIADYGPLPKNPEPKCNTTAKN